jgi:tetratricopeptide (TPR) repeat protein
VKRLAVAVVALALCAHAARADEQADRLLRAKAHFEAGKAHYVLGDFQLALTEFMAGYQLEPRPEFLLNLGQTYRRIEQLDRARQMYASYLEAVGPDDPRREEVRGLIAEIDEQRAHRAAPPPPPPTVAPPPAATVNAVAAPPPAASKPSLFRRTWWLLPVSVVAIAATVVAAIIVVLPFRQVGCGQAGLGCVDVTQ